MKPGYLKNGCAIAALMIVSGAAGAGDTYSPYAGESIPRNVYWGDTHLHSNMSVDANGMGNKALTPDDAYRFAKGEAITAHNGEKARLARPLDFLVVADHAENIGVMPKLEAGDSRLLKTETGKKWHERMKKYPLETSRILMSDVEAPFEEAMKSVFESGPQSFFWQGFKAKGVESTRATEGSSGYVGTEDFRRSVWAEVGTNAEIHNEPGKFTAFIGYEWTSGGQQKGNLHRIVIYRDGADKTNEVMPFSGIDSQNPEDLWGYMAAYTEQTDGDVISIPHNGNVSNGEMFTLQGWDGKPIGKAYAEMRSRWEPLYEVTQIKGDGETHPILSPDDEFADYETWNSWDGPSYEGIKTEGWEERKASEYGRSALKLGLQQQAKLGVNPFKIGFIGSTDAHTSMAAVAENNYWGKLSLYEPSPYRAERGWYMGASGYAAVWAQENTREALFDAMRRRETYATTGPRMTVRFFGGWNYGKNDAESGDLAAVGYAKGVPMGGDLTSAPKGKAPSFLIRAVKDPDGANLDRVQVIKGWRDKKGRLHEKVYNVALSDGRKDRGRKTKAVGNTVDLEAVSYTNTIGDAELATVWKDPDFNAGELAFYYVRVLEIPKPRWTAYDKKYFGSKGMPDDAPMTTQDRAYTSPIWYTP